MSSEVQVFFARSPVGISAEYGQPSVPKSEVDALVKATRTHAADDVRKQYEAQISDLRSEAVEFHQHLIEHMEQALKSWMREWESQVPDLVFSGVRAVLADFELTDEQLHGWVKRTLDEVGASDKGDVEVRLSPTNVQRIESFWKENDLSLPDTCILQAERSYSDVECRVVGRRGILDASLPVRLAQLQRLWKLDS